MPGVRCHVQDADADTEHTLSVPMRDPHHHRTGDVAATNSRLDMNESHPPELQRRGLPAGVSGAVIAGVGGILFAYNNGRRGGLCQYVSTSQCQVASDLWTLGLVLLAVGVVMVVIAILLAVMTEPQPISTGSAAPGRSFWITMGVVVAVVVAIVLVISFL